jgi:hypothetical protein
MRGGDNDRCQQGQQGEDHYGHEHIRAWLRRFMPSAHRALPGAPEPPGRLPGYQLGRA